MENEEHAHQFGAHACLYNAAILACVHSMFVTQGNVTSLAVSCRALHDLQGETAAHEATQTLAADRQVQLDKLLQQVADMRKTAQETQVQIQGMTVKVLSSICCCKCDQSVSGSSHQS